ncbi:MAG: hypothetical protein HY901_14620 [Deltaproteobacteria bacterium]|nr:hypothetical protein [Deltaproteobacteria bacterium]
MSWWKKSSATPLAGSALFRGRWVARPEDFPHLERRGVRLGAVERFPDGGGWKANLEHPSWGRATLRVAPDLPLPPANLVDWDPRLLDEEKAALKSCRYAIGLLAEARTGNVHADRKDLLRFLDATIGDEGVAAVDHTAQAFWSRGGLEEELSHDAELDIDGILTLHLLYDPADPPHPSGERRSYWVHSHGLSEIGFSDFDVLDPGVDVTGRGHEAVRALAFAIVEGSLVPDGAPFQLASSAQVRAVSARAFLAAAPPDAYPKYRADLGDEHVEGHVVVCEPGSRAFCLDSSVRVAGQNRHGSCASPSLTGG